DERRHPPGRGRGWEESWYLDFVDAGTALAGFVRLTLRPAEATAWFWAAMVGGGPRLVAVRDHEVPLPVAGGLEVRAPGLWTELVCETPLDHWSVGLEAFGVALDDPLEAWGRERGDPWALGLDVEWEGTAPATEWPAAAGGAGAGYWQGCVVHGDVLVGDQRFALDGFGTRVHRWGDPDRTTPTGWAAGRRDDGTHYLVVDPAVECDEEGRLLGVRGEAPAAHAPVLLPGAGRLDRVVAGGGWAEWFTPSGPA
ncbi:MAG TPA: hypothetical protein VJ653_08230, partial [Acidimicrobiales bacterium]|nr:hypothetical protein [Acidimicrobiales bacterium]